MQFTAPKLPLTFFGFDFVWCISLPFSSSPWKINPGGNLIVLFQRKVFTSGLSGDYLLPIWRSTGLSHQNVRYPLFKNTWQQSRMWSVKGVLQINYLPLYRELWIEAELSLSTRVTVLTNLSYRSTEEMFSMADESCSSNPAIVRRKKIAISIIFSLPEKEEAQRNFQDFFFSHFPLFESHMNKLKYAIEKVQNTNLE